MSATYYFAIQSVLSRECEGSAIINTFETFALNFVCKRGSKMLGKILLT